jgi:two-component system cell cycle response regulator
MSMRVVVVDPSRTVLKFVARMLEAGDHEALPFADGCAALAHIALDQNVGALITSAEIMSMSGLELCWEVRLLARGRRPIYIIVMSSNQERVNLVEALDMGADDFIGKPPVAAELYARLRAAGRLAALQNELIRLATTDPLTGAFNRRAFFERAADLCARADAGERLAAIMFDIDHFKRINDNYGHDAGDECIRAVAQEATLEDAVLGRLGGEEFALLLPGLDKQAAAERADDLRQRLAARQFTAREVTFALTCSFGVSDWEANDAINKLLTRADVALYAAKTGGRNRVVLANPSLPVSDYGNQRRHVRSRPRPDAAVPDDASAAAVPPTSRVA